MTSPLKDCTATFQRWLHLPDAGSLLVTLATVAANRMAGDPVWLLVIGPPGGGKTETLHPLADLSYVHSVATLTVPALLSGTPTKEKAQDAKGGLLRELGSFGIIVCKDFTSILSQHRDQRAEVLAALREIYDGSWTRHIGSNGGRKLAWAGKVGLVAACTPAIDSHHAVMGSMGERFVLYRLPPIDDEAQASSALAHVGREAQMRTELTEAVAGVLDHIDDQAEPSGLTDDEHHRLVKLVTLAVRCRSAIERDSYRREIDLIPEPEAPGRLAQVLLRLRNGLLAIGADDATTWAVVTKVALDSMPAIRRTVLDALAARGETTTTSAVAELIGYPTTTTRRALEDLAAHGVTHRTSQGQGKADLWQLSSWTLERWPTVPETSEGQASLVITPSNAEEDKTGTVAA